jgi:hypothetical protein
MPREDNVPLPSAFSQLANARSMGAQVRTMQGGSRLQAVRGKVMAIGVFQHGCVVGFSDDPRPFDFRYDEVDRFTQLAVRKYVNGGYRGTDITCWFGLADGRMYKVGGESTRSERHIVDDFRELIDPQIATAQLPRMQAALRQGQNIDFGGFTMEPTGLYMAPRFLRKERRLAWAGIQEVTVKAGSVVVIARGQRRWWASVPASSVPNLTAFLTLVHAATSS